MVKMIRLWIRKTMWSLPLLRKEDLGEVKKRVYKIINGEIDGN